MDNQVTSAVSLAIARGDVALWLGPDWQPPDTAEAEKIQSVDWLGAWIENNEAGLSNPSTTGSETRSGRLVIEVPDRIEEVLGKHFSIADVCPYFYLNGRGDGSVSLSARQRRISRDEKVQQLARLKTSVLIVAGYQDPATLTEHLEEITEAAPECRLIVVTGTRSLRAESVARIGQPFCEKVVEYDDSLPHLLSIIERRRAALPAGPSIRVGTESVHLDRLLRAEPPLDQNFIIVQEHDVRDPEPTENAEHLLVHLLSGGSPAWRAMAHQIEWQRPVPHRRDALKRLTDLRRGPSRVVCLNIPAESGAGLTTVLQQIAFDSARDGAPTFLHRGQSDIDYDRLRSFLTDLHASVEGRGAANEPSVIIFDSESVRADSVGQLRTMAARMTRDGRRVLLIRGIPVRSAAGFRDEARRLHRSLAQGEVFEEHWMPVLSAHLDSSQQQSLLRWADGRLRDVGHTMPPSASRVIQSWHSEVSEVPLLIFLYSILTGALRDAAGLGRHLVHQLLSSVGPDTLPIDARPPDNDEPLTGDSLRAAVARLQANLGRLQVNAPVALDDISPIFITLAAMGCLRLTVTRSILADLVSLPVSRVLDVVRRLEGWNMAVTDLFSLAISETRGTLAPAAFYTREDSVGLLHPTYGHLIFQWLRRPEATDDRRVLGGGGLIDSYLALATGDDDDGVPIRLLQPIFTSLKPIDSHVRFAENVAMRYLRLQKGRQDEDIAKWQWRNISLLLDAFSWLDEQVVRQSASLLHSRGITTYKSCRRSIELLAARLRYRDAALDFERAIELARNGGEERPVNIMSSLGLLYLGWLERERDAGNQAEAKDLDLRVEKTLRAAIDETPDANPYAVYGLASYLVSRYRRGASNERLPTSASAATDLAEAIELLQIEPDAYFEDDWNELRRNAIELLEDSAAQRIIAQLKQERNELGYVLEALRILQGAIPSAPTQESIEKDNIRSAAAVLHAAQSMELVNRSHLADLLRYALFSADADRLIVPAYRQRYDLICKLMGSRYLDVPVWLYDYAMLCFQVGQHGEGADAYARLRKGKRFFEVSRDRSCWLTENPDSLRPAQVFLRIVSVEGPEGKAWGRVEHPRRLPDPVPLSVRSFRSRGKMIQVGHSFPCQISLNPAGPFAEPAQAKEP